MDFVVSSMADGVIFLVCKWPAPGAVKTRLAKEVGDDAACEVARAFILDLVERLGGGPPSAKVLLHWPADAGARFEGWLAEHGVGAGWRCVPQVGGNGVTLADKLGSALEWADAEGVRGPRLFIGMDTPDLPSAAVAAAVRHAAGGDAFIRRATDGGYVLLALPEGLGRGAFEGIRWSTEAAGDDQVAAVRRQGVAVVEDAARSSDVDEAPDLWDFARRAAAGGGAECPRSAALAAARGWGAPP